MASADDKEEIEKLFAHKDSSLYEQIMAIAAKDGSSIIDATIEYCERHGLDIADVGRLIKRNKALRQLLKAEGEQLNFLQKPGSLPI